MPLSIFMPPCYGRAALQLAVGSALMSSALVMAQEAPKAQSPQVLPQQVVIMPTLKVGEATYKLLALQASGAAASDKQHPMPIAVAEKVYERYLNSFSHPIPEKSGSTLDTLE